MKDILFSLALIALGAWGAGELFCYLFSRISSREHPPILPPKWDREELTVVCMDCQAHIGGPRVNLADAIQARSVSHGLCPDCLRKRMAEMEK